MFHRTPNRSPSTSWEVLLVVVAALVLALATTLPIPAGRAADPTAQPLQAPAGLGL